MTLVEETFRGLRPRLDDVTRRRLAEQAERWEAAS